MRTDAVVLGDELDGLVATLRLLERGKSVRLLAIGGGSHHYAPDGLHVLGYRPGTPGAVVDDPFAVVDILEGKHPFRLLGRTQLRAAIDGFLTWAGEMGLEFRSNGRNSLGISLAGQAVPVFAAGFPQALFTDLGTGPVAVFCFESHRDFPAGLIATELRRQQIESHLMRLADPCDRPDSMRIAKFFDGLDDLDGYFRPLLPRLPNNCTCALFPAVLGLNRCRQVFRAAERVLGVPCREVPTLPPSIPGMRINQGLSRRIQQQGGLIHLGARMVEAVAKDGRIEAVVDHAGRYFEADTFVLATGGVLMGGLEIDSHGVARESVFGLSVTQSRPLEAETPEGALDALHEAGVETDEHLRPLVDGQVAYENVFVTGRTLGHWNPSKESSSEGVAIATGWAAANEACANMET